MPKENLLNSTLPRNSLKSVIMESKQIRVDRGEDFFNNKKNASSEEIVKSNSQIQHAENKNNFNSIRDSHLKLANFINDYDEKISEQDGRVLLAKKNRSKSIHLYLDENIEHFLNTEAKKAETKWGLRKNAGLGQLIQKFILNFIQLKKREERQLKKVKKLIEDFRGCLVDFKKHSINPEHYQNAEMVNQRMKLLSNDLRILLSLFEFEEEELKSGLGIDQYNWVEFIIQWKYHV